MVLGGLDPAEVADAVADLRRYGEVSGVTGDVSRASFIHGTGLVIDGGQLAVM